MKKEEGKPPAAFHFWVKMPITQLNVFSSPIRFAISQGSIRYPAVPSAWPPWSTLHAWLCSGLVDGFRRTHASEAAVPITPTTIITKEPRKQRQIRTAQGIGVTRANKSDTICSPLEPWRWRRVSKRHSHYNWHREKWNGNKITNSFSAWYVVKKKKKESLF